MLFRGTQFLCVGVLVPTTALAEVMDKEPSLLTMWGATAAFVTLALLLSQWKRWAALLIWPLSAAFGLAMLSELLDRSVGNAILVEAGPAYAAQGYVSAALSCLAPLILFAWGRRSPSGP